MYGKSILFSLCAMGLMASPLLAAPQAELDGSCFSISEGVDDSVLSQIKADMGKVEDASQLAFALSEVKNEDLAKLCKAFPDMYGLSIEDSEELTSIAPVAGLKKLKRFSLSLDGVADFSPLAGLASLEEIDIVCQAISDLKWMKGLVKLESIKIDGGSDAVSDDAVVKKVASFEGLPSLPNLDEVQLSNCAPADLTPLAAAFPGLVKLDLSNCVIKDLSPLAKLSKLEDLSLYGAHVKDFSPLAGCPALETLNYYATKGADYSTLGKLTQVKELNGGLTELADISWMAGMKNLRSFDLFSEKVADYSPMASSGVEQLQIWKMSVPQDLTSLGSVKTLTDLKLWDLNGMKGAAALASLPRLAKLTLDGVNAESGDPVDLSFLGKLSSLKELVINGSKVANFDAVAGCKALETVDIREAKGIASLAALKKLPALTSLTVAEDAFPDAELQGFDPRVEISKR
ncbi:MAG: hypothetical protein K6E40_04565 [Desulfovibrio sp.]|nr:hypothetical protein [Desulfovibrio sp.]